MRFIIFFLIKGWVGYQGLILIGKGFVMYYYFYIVVIDKKDFCWVKVV